MNERREFSAVEQVTVWQQDAWHCRYCLEPVFFAPTLRLLEQLNPGHSYYHTNGRHGSMLELFAKGWSSVDHIVAVALGGTNEDENTATACMNCNILKNDSPTELPPPPIPMDIRELSWDGFALLYPVLCEKPDRWTRALASVYGRPDSAQHPRDAKAAQAEPIEPGVMDQAGE